MTQKDDELDSVSPREKSVRQARLSWNIACSSREIPKTSFDSINLSEIVLPLIPGALGHRHQSKY